jgi:hypothetical protein
MLLSRAALQAAAAMADASRAAGHVATGMGLTKRSIDPSLTVVGPGADKAGSVYASIATRLIGGVGDSAADAAAVAAYLSIFAAPGQYLDIARLGIVLTLPGYGVDAGRYVPPPAHGLRV